MAENNEIEFEAPAEIDTKTVENKKLEGLESRVAAVETKVTQILTAVEEVKKLSMSKPTEAPAVAEMQKQVDAVSKKIEELEAKPARITQSLGEQIDTDKKVSEFAKSITGGEMLVYAEKKGLKWGNPKGD